MGGRIVKDAGCRAIIADAAGRALLPEDSHVIEAEALIDASSEDLPLPPASVPAYVMYTSGTTGTPKGVVIPQTAVLRLAASGGDLAISPQDRVMQAGPLAFDASTFEIWGALLNGARLVVATREEVLDPDVFAATLQRRGATVLWLTSALFNRQVDAAPASFRGLRLVLAGGEALSAPHVARALQASPNPPVTISPHTPIGAQVPPGSSTATRVWAMGRPIGTGPRSVSAGIKR
jgi:non-ribosomal peptide synthetase component F